MRRIFPFSLLLALVLCPVAYAADTAAEIQLQRQLDMPLDMTFSKKALSEAFEQISQKAEINIVVDQAAYDCLPYGPTTKVTATFQGTTVRGAIDDVLAPLGLEQAVSGATVIIRPTAAVARIGRRAEWEELQLIQTLRSKQLTKLEGDWTGAVRAALSRQDVNVRMTEMDEKALGAVAAQLPCSVAQALDAYAAQSNQVWTVRGHDVLVMPMKQWMEGQLERPIALSFTNAPLMNVVAEMGHLSRIHIEPAPGLYQVVPNVNVNSNNDTLIKTLNALSGATGIPIDIREDKIVLGLPVKPGAQPAAARNDAIIGRVNLWLKDGTVLDLYIHESDLPPEVAEARRKKLQEAIEALRKFTAEGTTTTQPAGTQPATASQGNP